MIYPGKYNFGYCKTCHEFKALQNDRCAACNKKEETLLKDIPDFLKGMFK